MPVGTSERISEARITPDNQTVFLENTMAGMSPDEQNLGAEIFRYLVTPSGAKVAYSADDLASYAGHSADAVRSILDRLAEMHIVRRLVTAANSFEQYEVFHDMIGQSALDWTRARADLRAAAAEEASCANEQLVIDSRLRVRQFQAAAVAFALLVVALLWLWSLKLAPTD